MHKLLTCTLLAALVAVSVAYDFQDSVYNEILAADWEELQEDVKPIHPRSRRDEEAAVAAAASNGDKCHHRRRPKFCCADEPLQAAHDEDKLIKKDCYKQITGKEKQYGGFNHHHDPFKCDKEKIEKHRKEMTCVMQCVGQKKDVLDADGNLKEENIRKQIKERFAKEEWLTDKLDAMVDKCMTEAKTASRAEKEDDKAACAGVGMKFGHCFWKELQFSCPAEQIKDQKSCDKVKERIKNHPDFPFPHKAVMDDEPAMDDV